MTTPSGFDRFVVDSSGWVEFLGGGPKADAFGKYLENSEAVLLPSMVVYEVYKKMLARADLGSGGTLLIPRVWTPRAGARFRYFIGRFGRKSKPSGESADGGCAHATAQAHQAELITSDAHFSGLPGVTLI